MGTTSTLLSIAGLAVGAYGVYYLYTNGYIDKILGDIKIPAPGGTTPAEDKEEKPAEEDEDDKKSKRARAQRAQIVSHGYVAAYRGWTPYNHRMTVV